MVLHTESALPVASRVCAHTGRSVQGSRHRMDRGSHGRPRCAYADAVPTPTAAASFVAVPCPSRDRRAVGGSKDVSPIFPPTSGPLAWTRLVSCATISAPAPYVQTSAPKAYALRPAQTSRVRRDPIAPYWAMAANCVCVRARVLPTVRRTLWWTALVPEPAISATNLRIPVRRLAPRPIASPRRALPTPTAYPSAGARERPAAATAWRERTRSAAPRDRPTSRPTIAWT
jgi:hypothetical protein